MKIKDIDHTTKSLKNSVKVNESLSESINLGDKVDYHDKQYIVIDDSADDLLVLRPFDRFKETDFDDIESGDNSEDVYIAPYQLLNNESLNEVTGMNEGKTYIDVHGGFGEPGEKITFKDIKKYWDDNFDTDPCLQEYDSFEDWFKETKQNYLTDIDESLKEPIVEGVEPQTSYKDAKQLVKNIDKFLKEIEENGVSAQYFSSYDLDALHKGRDAIFDFTVVYEENGFSDVLGENVEYKLAFKPVNDVTGINCVNGLISAVRSAGFNFNSARKIAGNYYITIICKPNDLSRAKLAIENCGFFKSWLESNESIKPKFSKLTLVNESNVFRFIKYKK